MQILNNYISAYIKSFFYFQYDYFLFIIYYYIYKRVKTLIAYINLIQLS